MEERERKWESEKRKRVGRKRKRGVQIYRTGKVKQGKTVDGRYNSAHLTITFLAFSP